MSTLIPMAMTTSIALKAGTRRGKWGLVVVRDVNGAVERNFKITEAELAALHSSARGIPQGVSTEEWTSGRACVDGQDFDVGDVQDIGGVLHIKYAEKVDARGLIVQSFIRLLPGEWTGVVPNVSATLDANMALSSSSSILTVENGVVIVKDAEVEIA